MTGFQSEFNTMMKRWDHEPEALTSLRSSSMERFNELGLPTKSWEEWQYADFSKIEPAGYRMTTAKDLPSIPEGTLEKIGDAHRIVILNGHYQATMTDLPKEIKIQTLMDVFQSEPSALQNGSVSEANPFRALNTAFMNSGLSVEIPEGIILTKPIHLLFHTADIDEAVMNHPRLLIQLGANAEAVFIEHYTGGTSTPYFQNCVTDVSLSDNSKMDHIRIQEEGVSASHIASTHYSIGANGSATGTHFVSGSALYRQNISVSLNGQGAEANVNGLCLSDQNQHLDHFVTIDHKKPHCKSGQLFKNILSDTSSGAFNGRIMVRPDSQKTDAQQTNKNLLLSDSALMNSNPQLEIYADDVKCAHGSTSGQLDQEAVFYLQSRGIKEEKAKLILINGFAGEAIQNVKNEATHTYLDNRLNEWLENRDTNT